MTITHELLDPGAHWCPDCGFPRELCACDDEVAYWEWAEDEWFDEWINGIFEDGEDNSESVQ